jgi:hypothetical protein
MFSEGTYWRVCLAWLQLQKIVEFLELLISSFRNSWSWSWEQIEGFLLSHFIYILDENKNLKHTYFIL